MSTSSSVINRRLEGKVAIITGGASGIGASTVQLFHEHGAKVVIADIQDNLGQALAQKLNSSSNDDNESVCFVHCDVSDEDQIIHLIDTTLSKFGKLDIMYNNAGIMEGLFGSILTTEKRNLERILSVNLIGSFLGAKHAAKAMIPNKRGCILFTSSACTKVADIAPPSYTLSKHGIVGLVESLAFELGAHGIRVNCVSPFGVSPDKLELDEMERAGLEMLAGQVGNLKGKILRAEDIARAALFLASDEAGYVSGVNFVVDGGYSLVNPTMRNAYMGFADEIFARYDMANGK